MDNFRAAFEWSCSRDDGAAANVLAFSLFGVWFNMGFAEGRSWYDRALAMDAPRPLRAGTLLSSAWVEAFALGETAPSRAREAVALAREVGDRPLLALALCAAGVAHHFTDPPVAAAYCEEAVGLGRELGDALLLGSALFWLAGISVDLGATPRAVALIEEARSVAIAHGHEMGRWSSQWALAYMRILYGDLRTAADLVVPVVDKTREIGDRISLQGSLAIRAGVFALMGETEVARASAAEALEMANEVGAAKMQGFSRFFGGLAALAAGDVAEARRLLPDAWLHSGLGTGGVTPALLAEAALADGDIAEARAQSEAAVASAPDPLEWQQGWACTIRARVALADGEVERAGQLAHQALAVRHTFGDQLGVCDSIELLAALAAAARSNDEAVRLLAAAQAQRDRIGSVRFRIHDGWYASLVDAIRSSLGDEGFDAAWADGAALSLDDAVAYAQRGRGERKRPSAGWDSLTPAERDVVRLLAEGLPNKEIAARLFISPRTVQAHLTHVYAKVGVSSRVQLATEAAKRS
jgi:DNA-binding CsgD family transcriptional regulator